MKNMSRRARRVVTVTVLFAVAGIVTLLLASGCAGVDLSAITGPGADGLLVATFNVHYLSPRAEHMAWERREAAVLRVLAEINADVIAFQEMETFDGGHMSPENVQLDSVLAAFPEYGAAAVADPAVYPATQPILYRRSLLQPVGQGFFFFSPTPDVIYSRPWHNRFPAFASWVRFRRADGGTFYLFNVHADASSARNRMKTARLVQDRIAARAHPDDPVILAGDFNAPAAFPSMRVYRRAGFSRAAGSGSTFHFNRGLHVIPAIDHVMVSEGLTVSEAAIVRRAYDGVWPSDHHPVAARVRLRAKP